MNEFYFELTIKPNENLEIFSSFLLDITEDALEERDGSLIVRSSEPLDDILWATEQLALKLNTQITTNLEKKKNEDWINKYKNSIQPIEVGSFYIRPEWIEAKENLTNIIINPALAFGSGHHATTFSCLEAISNYVQPNNNIIDVGCGSGILGLACKKLGANVELCDTDPLSVESCKENFELNQESYDKLWEGSVDKAKNKGSYDVVIANIIADVLRFIAKDLKSACKDDGLLILSGILDKKEELVKESFKDLTLVNR